MKMHFEEPVLEVEIINFGDVIMSSSDDDPIYTPESDEERD